MTHSLVVFGGRGGAEWGRPPGGVDVGGVTLRCGMVPVRAARFDACDPADAHRVLVAVTALSCNYRDRTFLAALRGAPAARYSPIGSEFAGVVLETGGEVETLRPGDRVMPNHHYAGRAQGDDGVREGVATNCASRAQQVHGERKLRKVPAGMPDGVAAAFSLNAQTAYSMVRKLDLAPGADVLVMSGGSNAALFTIAALRARGANVYASTSTPAFVARLAALGCAGVAAVPRGGDPRGTDPRCGMPEIVSLAREVGGFDAVVDPFFNLHLATAVQVLNPSGRYVTCGVAGETDSGTGPVRPALPDAEAVLRTVVQKNLTIVGNCLGVTDDLDRALHDYSSGALAVVIDSTFSGEAESAAFLTRTFNSGDRFGKVVFRYEQ